MANSTLGTGYTMIRLKQSSNGWELCEIGFNKEAGETNFFADFDNGTIYIDSGSGQPKNVIGYYDTELDSFGMARVFDSSRKRVIGRVGGELIYFRAREADHAVGRYLPEEECLAYYTKAGRITPKSQLFTDNGIINGNPIGGAAAFVALFFTFNFKSIYCDYFDLDADSFKKKYASVL